MVERAGDGRALERRVRALLSQRQDFTSARALALAAGIQPNTLTNWFSGKTAPQSVVLQKVADVLDVPVSQLWDAYDGGDPSRRGPLSSDPGWTARVEQKLDQILSRLDLLAEAEGAIRQAALQVAGELVAAQQPDDEPPPPTPIRPRGIPRG